MMKGGFSPPRGLIIRGNWPASQRQETGRGGRFPRQEAHFQAMEAQLVAASIALALEPGSLFQWTHCQQLGCCVLGCDNLQSLTPFRKLLFREGGFNNPRGFNNP